MSSRLSATRFLDLVVDPGSFVSWDEPPPDPPASRSYAEELAAARRTTGSDESVLTGSARIRGREVALLLCEFSFLAGSIGVAAAERLTRGIERATRSGLPVLASPASGGTRMQEGTVAFVQMVKVAAAVANHKAAGLPYLVYLRHPTTGGALASWGSLGHLTLAEPRALVGFLGPRVYESMHGHPFPTGVQVAENLADRGVIDGVTEPDELVEIVDRALDVIGSARSASGRSDAPRPQLLPDAAQAWESITRSRRRRRPGVRDLLSHAASSVVTLRGTGEGERDDGLLLALARFGDVGCVVVGHDRTQEVDGGAIGPGALRTARRGMRMAAQLGLPLVTVIDTSGAALSVEAEEGALAGEIARCLVDLVELPVPTLSLILGQGTGGGALALYPADRVIAAEHGWLAPLPPEGASVITYRDTEHAAEMATRQGVRSRDLLDAGIVDLVIAESLDPAEEPAAFCESVGSLLASELAGLIGCDPVTRRTRRAARMRGMGLRDTSADPA